MLSWTRRNIKLGENTHVSFLILTSKESNPSSFYKTLKKIITNKVMNILPKRIFENQGGCIQKRKIADNTLLVEEVIHSNRNGREKLSDKKMDIANAFDRLRH
jgi:hypothetical protein